MSTTTPNFGLIKPELTDPANITMMNENWNKIDTELTKRVSLNEDGKISSELLPDNVGSVKSINGFTGDVSLYTYGTDDIEAGVTPLETGKLYFVYE